MVERVGLLIVGPPEHGVVRFGRRLASALPGWPVATALAWSGDLAALGPLSGCTLVHAQVTDRLFGRRCEDAADAVVALAGHLTARGAGLTVTLHDLPAGERELDRRRRAAYRRIVEVCRGVVVSSAHEQDLLARIIDGVPVAVVPLPIDAPLDPHPPPSSPPRDAVVLGFLYPGKGHDEVLRALPEGLALTAIGRTSEGHEDLVVDLHRLAAASDREMTVTGFVPDDSLPGRLRAAGVPVAPHRTVSASGSINTWLEAGRRPLVPDIAYTREVERRCPGALWIYHDLAAALTEAVAAPAGTWLGDTPVGPSTPAVAASHEQVLGTWA